MAFRFRRRIKIAPGLSLNLGKKGVSISAGVRGAHVTTGTSGTRVSAGVPGTGLSVTSKVGAGRKKEAAHDEQPTVRPQLSFEERQARIKAAVYAIGIVAAGIWWLVR